MENKDKFNVSKLFKFAAFTVAEVLIVLGIVGIIAEMTIPTLMRNTQDAEFKAGFKIAFSEISQVLNRYYHETGGSLFMEDGSVDPAFWAYFKTEKVCTDSTLEECWHATYYTLDGGTAKGVSSTAIETIKNGAILANGTLIRIIPYPGTTSVLKLSGTPLISDCGTGDKFSTYRYSNSVNYILVVLIDVNGFKPPNRVGKDIYITNAIEGSLKVPLATMTAGDPPYDTCKCYGASCSYAALMGGS